MNEKHDLWLQSDSSSQVASRGESSHLMGAGIGAAGGAAAGAAIGTLVGGPFGALVCALIGATTGSLAAKHVSKIDLSSNDPGTTIRRIQPVARYESQRLTIPQLRRYIRGGCSCSVCELARTEISVLERSASSDPEARFGRYASPDGRGQDDIAYLAEGLDRAMEHIRGPGAGSLRTG